MELRSLSPMVRESEANQTRSPLYVRASDISVARGPILSRIRNEYVIRLGHLSVPSRWLALVWLGRQVAQYSLHRRNRPLAVKENSHEHAVGKANFMGACSNKNRFSLKPVELRPFLLHEA